MHSGRGRPTLGSVDTAVSLTRPVVPVIVLYSPEEALRSLQPNPIRWVHKMFSRCAAGHASQLIPGETPRAELTRIYDLNCYVY